MRLQTLRHVELSFRPRLAERESRLAAVCSGGGGGSNRDFTSCCCSGWFFRRYCVSVVLGVVVVVVGIREFRHEFVSLSVGSSNSGWVL